MVVVVVVDLRRRWRLLYGKGGGDGGNNWCSLWCGSLQLWVSMWLLGDRGRGEGEGEGEGEGDGGGGIWVEPMVKQSRVG